MLPLTSTDGHIDIVTLGGTNISVGITSTLNVLIQSAIPIPRMQHRAIWCRGFMPAILGIEDRNQHQAAFSCDIF